MRIPTVELKQRGKGVGRARGRPVGVAETQPRRKRKFAVANVDPELQRLRDMETMANRRKREGAQADPEPELEPVPVRTKLVSFGPAKDLVRYAPPPPPKKKRVLLSDATKGNLKKGAVALGTAAGTAAAAIAAAKLKRRYNAPLRTAVEGAIDRVLGPDEETWIIPRETGFTRLDNDDSDDDGGSDGFVQVDNPGDPGRQWHQIGQMSYNDAQIPIGTPASAPPLRANYPDTPIPSAPPRPLTPQVVTASPAAMRGRARLGADGQGPRPQRTTAANRLTGDYAEFAGQRRRRAKGQDGGGIQPHASPCEHLRQAGRQVFELAENGDKKAARKELKELTEHLREMKSYVASI